MTVRLAIIFSILFSMLTACQVNPTIESSAIRIPHYFYGDSPGHCPMSQSGQPYSVKVPSIKQKIAAVAGYNWQADHDTRSNSLTVRHEPISRPARMLFAVSHTAIAAGESDSIRDVVSILVDIAEADTLLETMTVAEATTGKDLCYAGKRKTSAPCDVHAPQFAAIFAGNYLVAAILLESSMTAAQRSAVNAYVEKMYRKYIVPVAESAWKGDRGYYQMANGGIAVLAYAAWTKDTGLAARTFGRMFGDIDRKFFEDGYINNNSFRGVRGFWYHTYGVNSALAVIGLAKSWGVSIPKEVNAKVVASTRLINVGVTDLAAFKSRPFSGYTGNASSNPRDARPHIHQMAVGIDTLAMRYAGVTLERDPTYLRKRRNEEPSDFTLGFNPVCMVRQGIVDSGHLPPNVFSTLSG